MLPRNSTEGESRYDNGKVRLVFRVTPEGRQLSVAWPDFDGQPLAAEIDLRLAPGHESTVVVIPIRGNRFYYNRKVNCLPAEGWLQIGGAAHRDPAGDLPGQPGLGPRGLGVPVVLGVGQRLGLPARQPRTIGLNLGFGFGDTSAATENTLILDGRVHKLGQVDFTYDPADFKRPWRMVAPDGRLDLSSSRSSSASRRPTCWSSPARCTRCSAATAARSGPTMARSSPIDGLVGFAEEHHARW